MWLQAEVHVQAHRRCWEDGGGGHTSKEMLRYLLNLKELVSVVLVAVKL